MDRANTKYSMYMRRVGTEGMQGRQPSLSPWGSLPPHVWEYMHARQYSLPAISGLSVVGRTLGPKEVTPTVHMEYSKAPALHETTHQERTNKLIQTMNIFPWTYHQEVHNTHTIM